MISRNQKYLYLGTEVVLAVAAVGLLERTKPKLPIAMLMWRPHVSRTQDDSERALFPRRRTLPRSSSLRCARHGWPCGPRLRRVRPILLVCSTTLGLKKPPKSLLLVPSGY